jgi:hypothetical protein
LQHRASSSGKDLKTLNQVPLTEASLASIPVAPTAGHGTTTFELRGCPQRLRPLKRITGG